MFCFLRLAALILLFGTCSLIHAQDGADDALPLKKSAVDNSFAETVGRLDAGGELLLYLSTEQVMQRMHGQLESLMSQPMSPYSGMGRMMMVWQGGQALLNRMGLMDMTGVGISSIHIQDDLSRSRMMLHHRESEGALWNLFGAPGESLALLQAVPAEADLVVVSKIQAQTLVDSLIKTTIDIMPQMADQVDGTKQMLALRLGVDVDKVLADFGNEMAIVVSFSKTEMMTVQVDRRTRVQVAKPQILLLAQTKGTYIHDLLANQVWKGPLKGAVQAHQGINMLVAAEESGGDAYSVRMTLAHHNNVLMIGSSPEAVTSTAAAAGILANTTLAGYAANLPTKYNQMVYISPRINEILQSVIEQNPQLASTLRAEVPVGLGVMTREQDGLLFTSNSPSGALFLLAQVAALPAAVTLPALMPRVMGSRSKAQAVNSAGNLKQAGLGLLMYSGDHNGAFPKEAGYKGFNVLIDENYIQAGRTWVHPAEMHRFDPNARRLASEESTSYGYVGAGLKDDNARATSTPLTIEKPHPGRPMVIVGYIDGHVESHNLPEAKSVTDVVKALKAKNPNGLSDADYELLLKNAAVVDAATAD